MTEPVDELLNVHDEAGRVVGARPRKEAKAAGLAVGAVNVLLVNAAGELLMQRRPADKENGGRWDKSVGGHVGAGEDFDQAAVRETGEELFDDPRCARVRLAGSEAEFKSLAGSTDLGDNVLFRRAGLQLGLRDVRVAPGGGIRNVVYHIAIYIGRTDVPIASFSPQESEIDILRYVAPREIDAMLLAAQLPPNMAFLWLTQGLRVVQDRLTGA